MLRNVTNNIDSSRPTSLKSHLSDTEKLPAQNSEMHQSHKWYPLSSLPQCFLVQMSYSARTGTVMAPQFGDQHCIYSVLLDECKATDLKHLHEFQEIKDVFYYVCLLDSVWGVYVLPEEVGSRIKALGINTLALRNSKPGKASGCLNIINPTDPNFPIVSWDPSKIRRVGCFSNLVFIEIGRHCQGGPGLLWLRTGSRETSALLQTLQRYNTLCFDTILLQLKH